ncbi:MAG: Gfo/Idh/MocA family oxidoreductase [bacterium]|nr:Gfo/Idh/MocA family oxidoreductase [bacterium]
MGKRVGVIGLGIMGTNVTQVLERNPQVELAALCTLNKKKLEKAQKQFGVSQGYTDYREMLEKADLDIVYIATPDWAHLDPVIDSLEAGCHVHVEKPMTTDLGEATKIVEKVKSTGMKLQVSYNHRWLAPYNATWNMIREGQIGKPLMGYARKNNPISVPTEMLPWAAQSSPAWFLSAHDIDLMCWWFDQSPVEVHGYGIKEVLVKRGIDTYDMIQGLVKFDGGAVATFESAWVYPNTHPSMPDSFMEVIGEKGHVHLDRKAEAIEMSTEEKFKWPRSLLNYKVFDKWVGAFPSCVNSFIDAVVEDRQPFVTALDGWRATAVLDALHQSVAKGGIVKVQDAPDWP